MKKILITIAALALAGGGWYYYKSGKKSADVKYARAEVLIKDISEFVETTGEVIPLNRVEVQPPSSGRIEQIVVDEGDKIKAGEIMALMSSADRVAILDAARALGDDQYKNWKETYKPIKIISPLDGTIILKDVVEGQTVGQSTVLFAISDNLILSANVDESDIGKVRERQTASIVLDAYPDNPVKGKVFQILDEGKNQSNVITYKVKIKPDLVHPFFKSQMTANIKIETAKKRNALLIPTASVTIDPSGSTAVITEVLDKKPVYTKIETGLDQGDYVEVTKGLKEGDIVMFVGKNYKAQKASDQGTNPLMPKRPGMVKVVRKALH
ncbi:MAG: efflux RND transporter periplasmic adaptor subunit [Elusimicrobia bacterium]|nr:efflux RND transporter periplasmic adaptor subunit [Elusimicrobiota bacterium]